MASPPPAYQRTFKGVPLYYFVDVTTCHPTSARVAWRHPPKTLPLVLNNSFSCLWSAAIWVAEKVESDPSPLLDSAWDVIQTESGINSAVFDFASYPWLQFFQSPESLGSVIASLPSAVLSAVQKTVQWEQCTEAHVTAFDSFLYNKAGTAIAQQNKDSLDAGDPHFTLTYIPQTLPGAALPPDVVPCRTLTRWLFERAQHSPLTLFAGANQLLWVSRANGIKNQNAQYASGLNINGEAWAFAIQPIFPTVQYGSRTSKEPGPVSRRRGGGAAKTGKVSGSSVSSSKPKPAQRGRK